MTCPHRALKNDACTYLGYVATEHVQYIPVAKKHNETASLSAGGIACLMTVSWYVILGATMHNSSSKADASNPS